MPGRSRRRSPPAVRWILAFMLTLVIPHSVRADGIVTSANPSNLVAAVKDGGLVILTYNGTITLTNTLVVVTNTTIVGAGQSVISGNQSNRVFHVSHGVTLTLQSVIIINGRAANGGGIYNAGGTVQITNSVLSGHQAVGRAGNPGAAGSSGNINGGNGTVGTDGFGGAIYNLGVVNIDGSLLTNNTATGGNGGPGGAGFSNSSFGGDGGNGANGGRGLGGGIYSTGTVYMINSTFTANHARGGDGGSNGLGAAALVAPGKNGTGGLGNTGQGGAIFSTGLVTITNSVLYSNIAQGGKSGDAGYNVPGVVGGAATGGAIYSRGTVHLGNSTIALNDAKGGSGGRGGDVSTPFIGRTGGNGGPASAGGLYSTNFAVLFQSTFGSNGVTGGLPGLGGGPNIGPSGATGAIAGANITRASGTVRLKHSIMAEGTAAQNVAGGLTDGGLNISSDASYTAVAGLGSRNSTNPRLLPFGNFTGSTLLMGLATNSPAIDAITNVSLAPLTDQRGIPRPQGSGADIGAYEATPLFNISGKIVEGTNGIPEYTVKASTTSAKSSSNGSFSLINLIAGVYVVAPSQIGAGVTPTQTVITVGPSITNLVFRANPPFLRLSLTNLILGSNTNSLTRSAQILVGAMPLQKYVLQGLTNLNWTNWLSLSTNTAGTNGNYGIFDTTITNNPQKYYRVVKP